jgi:hypothetical protein
MRLVPTMQKTRSGGKRRSGIQSTRFFCELSYAPSTARYSAIRSRLKLFVSFRLSHDGTLTPPRSMPLCGVA